MSSLPTDRVHHNDFITASAGCVMLNVLEADRNCHSKHNRAAVRTLAARKQNSWPGAQPHSYQQNADSLVVRPIHELFPFVLRLEFRPELIHLDSMRMRFDVMKRDEPAGAD